MKFIKSHIPWNKEKPEIRIWKHIKFTKKCWNWTGCIVTGGYGGFLVNGKCRRVHRFVYELLVNEIPNGKVIDHLCRNKLCVNPGHLEAVTHKENILRGEGLSAKNSKKELCHKGHIFNKIIFKRGKPSRSCTVCRNEYHNKRYHRKRKEILFAPHPENKSHT